MPSPSKATAQPSAQALEGDSPGTENRSRGIPELAMGSRLRLRVKNLGDRPLYLMLMGLESSGNAVMLYPGQVPLLSAGANSSQPLALLPGESLMIPRSLNTFEWVVRGLPGLVEMHLVSSIAPFSHTLANLQTAGIPVGPNQRLAIPTNPVEIAQSILQDLHQASQGLGSSFTFPGDSFALNVYAWATLSFFYQIV